MDIVRWGIIGCGDVVERKSGATFSAVEGSEIAGVYSRTYDRAKEFAEKNNIPLIFASGEELVNSSAIDIVYIATPPSTHKEYALLAINAGKHVYIEKPMAVTYAECQEIEEAAKKKGVKVFTAFYRRGLEKFKAVKRLLQEDCIGKVRFVDITLEKTLQSSGYVEGEPLPWRFKKEISGGGLFLDLGPHVFDIMDYLLGEISSASAYINNSSKKYEVEDTVTASFQFNSGVVGAAEFSFSSYEDIDEVEIVGEKGKIIFSVFEDNYIILKKSTEEKKLYYPNPEPIQGPYIKEIVKEFQGKIPSLHSLESSMRCHKIIFKDILKED